MSVTPLHWECINCLVDWPEPYCDACGANLVDTPLLPDAERFQAVAAVGARVVQAAENVWGEHHPVTESVRATHERLLFDMGGYDDGGEFSRRVREPLRLVTK